MLLQALGRQRDWISKAQGRERSWYGEEESGFVAWIRDKFSPNKHVSAKAAK